MLANSKSLLLYLCYCFGAVYSGWCIGGPQPRDAFCHCNQTKKRY